MSESSSSSSSSSSFASGGSAGGGSGGGSTSGSTGGSTTGSSSTSSSSSESSPSSSSSSFSTTCDLCKQFFIGVRVHGTDPLTFKVDSNRENLRHRMAVLDHFVTPRRDTGDVILQAVFDQELNCGHITWERADGGSITSPAVGTDGTTAKFPRAGTTAGNLKIGQRIEVLIKCDGVLIWKGVVWVAWANVALVTPTNPAAVTVRSTPIAAIRNGANEMVGRGIQLKLSSSPNAQAPIEFRANITPVAMFDTNQDIPALHGRINKDIEDGKITVPKGDEIPLIDPSLTLKGGVIFRWDISRQTRVKIINPKKFSQAQLIPKGTFWNALGVPGVEATIDLIKYPEGVAENENPKPIEPEDPVGNDDPIYTDTEHIWNPYTNPATQRGQLRQTDSPGFPLPHNIGGDVDTFELRTQFREFVRLYIGKKWYLISEPKDNEGNWKVSFKFKKVEGDWLDDGSTGTFKQNNSDFKN